MFLYVYDGVFPLFFFLLFIVKCSSSGCRMRTLSMVVTVASLCSMDSSPLSLLLFQATYFSSPFCTTCSKDMSDSSKPTVESKSEPEVHKPDTPATETKDLPQDTTENTHSDAPPAESEKKGGEAAPPPKKTRLLKEVEEEENKLIYNLLYKSLENESENALNETVEASKESKKEFYDIINLTVSEKFAKMSQLANINGGAKRGGTAGDTDKAVENHNKKALKVLFFASSLMFTVPLFVLLFSDRFLSNDDQQANGSGAISLQSSLLAVGTVILIMIGYMIYALCIETSVTKDTPLREKKEQ
ncbi:hypothetical protein AGDE_08623 [Angomonas deanei]|uniref:Uncharacterized protein n=1 Tax=Angomonas deanei TaxID=59799 RepID=A0A7G2C9S5_9TRYP|nr:hypothetical protein AGDE_08623 [Angomonas deanei]CAD2216610.1 hypothetical protein, conserved [Angomonas deanei]|eukprot:EPY32510.1 hypothetical protein AGDE_08623 [Angomonas deanei]